MNKLTIAVVFGSRSTEHDVSVVTAIGSIIKPLEMSGNYNVVPVYIDKNGNWFSDPKLKDISLFSSGKIDEFLQKQKPLAIKIGNCLELVKLGIKPKSIKIDVVFPATHGTHGEDGELMGLLEMAGVPYIGCDMPSSVLSMDKALAKIITAASGIPSSKFIWFYENEFKTDKQAVLRRLSDLKFPLFVKPVHLGSSIAITKVNDASQLINAIEVAAHYDNKIIVEEAVTNLVEVTVPVMGNLKPVPALVEQPLTESENFFDFESKYMRSGKKGGGSKQAQGYSKLPADIPTVLYKRAENLAIDVYKALGCSGIARVDLLIDMHSKEIYFNEVNPLPGSLYEHNWRQSGISSVELVDKLVKLSIERFDSRKNLTTVFTTSYLKQY